MQMSLTLYIDGQDLDSRRGPRKRLGPLVISAALHGTAFFALMNAPEIMLPEPAKSEYKQAIEGREEKLVWYRFKELPDVTPPEARPEQKPLRAEVQAKQQIVASRKDAPRRQQMIWSPAPELKETKPVELPNILAVRLPEITKPFVTPPDIQKPIVAKIDLPADAPELQAQALNPVKLPDAAKIVKRFVPPPRRVPDKVTEVVQIANAPQVEASLANPTTALNYTFKAPARPFTAPAARKAATTGGPVLPEAPELVTANSRDLNLAVVGLNPSDKPIALPENSNPAQFSAGPQISPDGASAAGDGKGLTVPDLYVRGAREAKPDLIAQAFAAPSSALTLRAAARGVEPGATADPAGQAPPGAVKVSSAPDPRFNGRDIYMMVIQMPNLTSYSGSWLMWYADRTAREAGLAPVSPPVAHRKVDPKYVAAAADDRIEGKVQLACVIAKDGHVSNVELVLGLDDRLNRSAEEALAKWEFTPATRRGEPVAVDVLVEIPFRLAPHTQVRY
jgi:TonB family protein